MPKLSHLSIAQIALFAGSLTLGSLTLAAQTAPASSSTPPNPPTAETPTYQNDVQPILERQCQGCHRDGGIAPFSLEGYAQASQKAALIAAVTQARYMPPWMPGPKTPALKYERKLSDDEIKTLGAWAAAGAPLGE